MAVEVFMPKLTDNMETGEIVEWLVEEGANVEKGQPILLILTDKATVELDAPTTGILRIRTGATPGANIPVGVTIALLTEVGEDLSFTNNSVERVVDNPIIIRTNAIDATQKIVPSKTDARVTRATPVVRRLAKGLGIDLSQVNGTGHEGRVTREDVLAFVESSKKTGQLLDTAIHVTNPAQGLPREDSENWVELTGVQRLTGQRMLQSVQTAPQFSLTVNVDMTNALHAIESYAEPMTAERVERPSITGILVKVVAFILRETPRVNASFIDGRLKLHHQINIGVAVGSDDGLYVPVIKNPDQKSLSQISDELKIFKDKALQSNFSPEDLNGSTFTISNLGMYGVDRFNAILNPPECAILAVGRVAKTPVAMPDDTIGLRPIMSLTLSIDHRVLDGIQSAKFITKIKESLEQPFLFQ
jgi:pyruvate dehydrogenase E2 component (dihydrolipoamide acetyltransferase)